MATLNFNGVQFSYQPALLETLLSEFGTLSSSRQDGWCKQAIAPSSDKQS